MTCLCRVHQISRIACMLRNAAGLTRATATCPAPLDPLLACNLSSSASFPSRLAKIWVRPEFHNFVLTSGEFLL